jgi:hypothetical protein
MICASYALEGPQNVEHAIALKASFAAEISRRIAQNTLNPARLADQF